MIKNCYPLRKFSKHGENHLEGAKHQITVFEESNIEDIPEPYKNLAVFSKKETDCKDCVINNKII